MPRNEAKPLDRVDSIRQSINAERLRNRNGEVTVHYRKRDETVSSSTGTVAFFNGKIGYDTGSVTIADPVKGNRTINLHRIIVIE
jgi:hypothetical protein